jgi:plastocyanin
VKDARAGFGTRAAITTRATSKRRHSMRPPFIHALFALGFLALLACGGSESMTPPASNPDPTPSPTTGTTDSPLNGCSSYSDHTADGDARTIAWDFSVTSDPAHCMMVKVGQTVHWNGDQSIHPLGPKGGDAPNPTNTVDPTGHVSFPHAGTFGYTCLVHAPMIGAIKVVP